jgi:superfamily I DNA/RNA helicase
VDDVAQHSDRKQLAYGALQVIRKALNVARIETTELAELRRSILAGIRQQRIARVATPARGILVLTCHETKSMEFDAVVLPFVSTDCFPDADEESQLLYVSLSRARSRLIIRTASGRTPSFLRALGIS